MNLPLDAAWSTRLVHSNLPIFRLENARRNIFYAPGCAVEIAGSEAVQLEQGWQASSPHTDNSTSCGIAGLLEAKARDALVKREHWLCEPFAPECLTIYLSNSCNLACTYCYAAWSGGKRFGKGEVIDIERADAAARLVAEHCAAADKPFSLVLHGGGEPTRHWKLIDRLETLTRTIAEEFKIDWFGYIATNGVYSEEHARRLAKRFSIVGLSCDGPPEIQDRQRPRLRGGMTSSVVERTAHAIHEAGGRIEVRATITPYSMTRQVSLVSYLHQRLGAKSMRFEPVYRFPHQTNIGFQDRDAWTYARHFLAAREKAESLGCELTYSGARYKEIHGPYCDVLRNVLHLLPDGTATACFFSLEGSSSRGGRLRIGQTDAASGRFVLDHERIAAHRHVAAQIPAHCTGCISAFHCARSCPEVCRRPDDAQETEELRQGSVFRCLVQKNVALAQIVAEAATVRNEVPATDLW